MTVESIRTQIKSDLVISGSDYDTQIDTAIRAALRQLRQSKFWFLEKFTQITLLEGNSTLTLPTDFSVEQSFDIIVLGSRYGDGYGFDLLPFDELRERYWTTSPLQTERPKACAIIGRTLYFSHIADTDYTLDALYYRQDATLPQAGDTSIWEDDGYDVLRSLAMLIFKRESQHFTPSEEDGSMASMYKKALERRHEKFLGSRS